MNTQFQPPEQWNQRPNDSGGDMGQSEPMFRLLFERSADSILLMDPRRQVFVDCNQAAVEMMRASGKEQILQTNPADVSPEFQPDGRSSREKTTEMIALTLERGGHRFEWLSRRFDGTDFHVEVMATTVQTSDNPLVAVICRDITGRKAAEAALRDSEARFRMLFEQSADAMSIFDPELGRFIESNEAVVRQSGAPNKEALGTASPAEISPERQPDGRLSSEKAAEMVQLALANGSHRFEWLSRCFDGREIPLDIVMTAVPFMGRRVLFVVSRDITKQKLAEQEILRLNSSLEQRVAGRTIELVQANDHLRDEIAVRRRQEKTQRMRSDQIERYRDVLLELAQSRKADFNSALELICARAASTLGVARVSYWSLTEKDSAIICELLSLRDTGKSDPSVRGVRLGSAMSPAYFDALATKRPVVANDVYTHAATSGLGDSYLKPLGITSMLDAPVWVRGEVVGVLCHEHIGPARAWSEEEVDFASSLAAMVSLALEESQRAQSEARLRESESRFSAAFQASPIFITISRLDDGRYVLANEAFLKWSDYQLDEVIGRDSMELNLWAEPADRGPFWEELKLTRSIRERECRVRSRHGRIFTMLLSADIIEINGVPHLLTMGVDITQRKLAETELLKTLAREKELGQLRSNFVSMVSHEFRTPLGIIQSSAEILDDYLDRLDDNERSEHLQSIKKNIRRMAALMEEVLLIGAFDAGRMDFKPEPLDLRQFSTRLVDEILSACDRRCPIELTLGELPGHAMADERLLRHILTNLLTNAVKYSNAGQRVQFQVSREAGEAVCVVRDEGIGIPDADREWLFSAFHRGQNVGDRPGTGLGLVIVKRCVDLHAAKIQVQSAPGAGTTVTVRIPVFQSGLTQS